MTNTFRSYNSPLLELRPQPGKGDFGIYTTAPAPAGTLLLLFTGDIVDEAELAQVFEPFVRGTAYADALGTFLDALKVVMSGISAFATATRVFWPAESRPVTQSSTSPSSKSSTSSSIRALRLATP